MKAELNERDGISEAGHPAAPAPEFARDGGPARWSPINPPQCEGKGVPAGRQPIESEAQESIEGARSSPLLAAANSADRKPLLSGTIAHNSEHVLLKLLIAHDTSEASCLLLRGLAQTEQDHKCIRRALFLVVLLFMLSLSGLGYCAILLPEVFHYPTHLFVRSLSVLALGSLISQAVFLGYLLWHRTVVTRLHEECQRLILALTCCQLKVPAAPIPAIQVPPQPPGTAPRSSTPLVAD